MVLSATPEQLLETQKRLETNNVPHKVISESDPPYSGEVTAIGVCPAERSKLKRYFSSLPLLK